jgi:hypothetical protein
VRFLSFLSAPQLLWIGFALRHSKGIEKAQKRRRKYEYKYTLYAPFLLRAKYQIMGLEKPTNYA